MKYIISILTIIVFILMSVIAIRHVNKAYSPYIPANKFQTLPSEPIIEEGKDKG